MPGTARENFCAAIGYRWLPQRLIASLSAGLYVLTGSGRSLSDDSSRCVDSPIRCWRSIPL